MDRITALIITFPIAALVTYLVGGIIFSDSSEIAAALKSHQLTMHFYMVLSLASCVLTYLILSWLPHIASKLRSR